MVAKGVAVVLHEIYVRYFPIEVNPHYREARQLGTREVVIAGDMNTELLRGSCVRAMLGGPRGAARVCRGRGT